MDFTTAISPFQPTSSARGAAILWPPETNELRPRAVRPLVDGVDLLPEDAGAAAAIEEMRAREAIEQLALQTLPFYLDNQGLLTGTELAEDVLSGVLDPGNELAELLQLQRAAIGMNNLDNGARRVLAVVDQASARLIREGRTSMTSDEKIQFARELRQAASALG